MPSRKGRRWGAPSQRRNMYKDMSERHGIQGKRVLLQDVWFRSEREGWRKGSACKAQEFGLPPWAMRNQTGPDWVFLEAINSGTGAEKKQEWGEAGRLTYLESVSTV